MKLFLISNVIYKCRTYFQKDFVNENKNYSLEVCDNFKWGKFRM